MMKCIEVTRYGKADDVLRENLERELPRLDAEKDKGKLLVKVHAVSLSPGDCRNLVGAKAFLTKFEFPYVPLGDVSGVVEAVAEGEERFKVGDEVIGTWDSFGEGGLAEYTTVKTKCAVHKPESLTHEQACALVNSGVHALLVSKYVSNGDRVMILGGAGGVGTMLCQLARTRGASFIAATSTATDLLLDLGVDRAIDYTKENWWELPEFIEEPFDLVIDCAEGKPAWDHARNSKALKKGFSGGKFVAVASMTPGIEELRFSGYMGVFGFLLKMLWNRTWSKIFGWSVPQYRPFLGGVTVESLEELVQYVNRGELRVIVDRRGPFSFDLKGATEAFNLQYSMHGHGKVVIKIV